MGAIIAGLVQAPALAIPLAFVSHFALDALPHFGIAIIGGDVRTRNNQPIYKLVTRLDALVTLAVLIIVPWVLAAKADWWLVLTCMFAAVSPDMIWVYRFFKELKTGIIGPASLFSRFHKRIQWGERPWGWVIELVWLIGSVALLGRIVS